MERRMGRMLLWALVGALAVGGCATPVPDGRYVREGKEYGVTEGLFRDRWWNFYERGLSFAEGAFSTEAIADFREAIGQRNQDQWRARTYGLHFVDYFPHRELGIVYYRLERYDEAVEELESSLENAESAKAKFFLNKARKEMVKRTGRDRGAPVVNLLEPAEGLSTKEFTTRVTGVVEDDTYVAAVRINGRSLPLELASPRITFDEEVALDEGVQGIRIVAEDLLGNSSTREVQVAVDRRGPVITIQDVTRSPTGWKVRGTVTDETEIASCTLNGRPVRGEAPDELLFSEDVEGQTVTIEARDSVGNLTVAEIPSTRVTASRPGLIQLAGLGTIPLPASDTSGIGGTGETDLPRRYALGLAGLVDGVPPEIRLKGLGEAQDVFDERVLLEGSVRDESPIRALRINGDNILTEKGKQVHFSYLMGLEVGGNVIEIEAEDVGGNSGQRSVSVQRKEQKVRQLASRMRLAVLPMELKGEASVIGTAVYDAFIAAVVNQGRFDLVERARIEDVLRELELSGTDLVEPGTAARAGRMVAAEALVTGTVVETATAVEVIARVIDTETSLVLSANDVFDEDKSLRAVMGLMDRLAHKFKRDFPLVEGLVIEAGDGEIMVDLGKQHRLKKNIRLIVFREGSPVRHPVTGKVLGADTEEIAEAQVKDVFAEFSKAGLTRGAGVVKTLDRVITK